MGSQRTAEVFSGAGTEVAVRPLVKPITLAEDWKHGLDAHRVLDRSWTGVSRFEASDGSWREVVHTTPRRAMMTPMGVKELELPGRFGWTGKRLTYINYRSTGSDDHLAMRPLEVDDGLSFWRSG